MARSRSSRRSGPGYVGLICFIVLSIGLIVGYVWLVPQFMFAISEMVQLNSDIKEQLEDRVGKELGARAQVPTKSYERQYDTPFLKKIGDSAADGLKYADLVALCGWEGEKPLESIRDYLKSIAEIEPQQTLRAFLGKMEAKLKEREDLRLSAEAGREKAVADFEIAVARRVKAEERAVAVEDEKIKKLREADLAFQKDRDRYITQMDDANAQAVQDRKALELAGQEHRRETMELEDLIAKKDDRIAELEAELAKKKPQPLKVTEGEVLEMNYTDEFVIINLGKRENVAVGETFSVMQIGPGGVRTPKATVQVTRVKDNVSRADIMSLTPDADVVVPGDIVLRDRKLGDAE